MFLCGGTISVLAGAHMQAPLFIKLARTNKTNTKINTNLQGGRAAAHT